MKSEQTVKRIICLFYSTHRLSDRSLVFYAARIRRYEFRDLGYTLACEAFDLLGIGRSELKNVRLHDIGKNYAKKHDILKLFR